MLDIFLTTFITAGDLVPRDRSPHGHEIPKAARTPTRVTRLFGSPYRFWAGFMLGAAVATKWSGAFALALAAILCATWVLMGAERARRSRLARWERSLIASFVARSLARVSGRLRFVLLPARVRDPRLPDAPTQDAAIPAGAPQGPTGELPPVDVALAAPPDPVLQVVPRGLGPAGSWRSATRRSGGGSSLCFPSPPCRSCAGRRGRTPSRSAATRRCSSRGSSSAGRSSSSTCSRPCRSCASAWRSILRFRLERVARVGFRSRRRSWSPIAFVPVWTGWWVPRVVGGPPSACSRLADLRSRKEEAAPEGRLSRCNAAFALRSA